MVAGLAAGYGTLAAMAGRYLYPAKPRVTRWLYVAPVARLAVGDALVYRTPIGETVTIARQGAGEAAEDFAALSSTCPHLGCQVHWEAQNSRFFCPCHNGVFDPAGSPLSGPPAEAGTPLPRFPLRVEGGILYIEAPVERLADAGEVLETVARAAPGHDPCLGPNAGPNGRAGGPERA
jgi:cytochrome b6-f complex iron-sulfur subunit